MVCRPILLKPDNMAITFRRKNILLLVVILFIPLVFLWKRKQTSSRDLLTPNPSSSSTLKSSFIMPGGPVLQQPLVEKNRTSDEHSYTLEEMRTRVKRMNFVQFVKNKEHFGDHRADDPVIVVQVHDRPELLKLLLFSLRVVKGIESATLVLSRDKFTPEMDTVIDKNIKFCRYLEIFFPFSMQLFPDKFPGEDPNDCPRDLSKSDAKSKECNNAEYPDMYGHYREVKFVQLKHHWFWKLNMIFQGIREIKGNTGPILLLEDDNFVVPDLIHIMRKAEALRDKECKDCFAVTLGAYASTTDYGLYGTLANVKAWFSSEHNIGMVVNQLFYDQLSRCAEYFCKYDDYNWDWTLQSTALNCFTTPLYSLILRVPRVYHLGCTGFHQKQGGRCNVAAEVKRLQSIIESESANLFPPSLQMQSVTKTLNAPHAQNGGWGDIRDRELCQTYESLCKTYLDIFGH